MIIDYFFKRFLFPIAEKLFAIFSEYLRYILLFCSRDHRIEIKERNLQPARKLLAPISLAGSHKSNQKDFHLAAIVRSVGCQPTTLYYHGYLNAFRPVTSIPVISR